MHNAKLTYLFGQKQTSEVSQKGSKWKILRYNAVNIIEMNSKPMFGDLHFMPDPEPYLNATTHNLLQYRYENFHLIQK